MELNQNGEIIFPNSNEIIFDAFLGAVIELEKMEIGSSDKKTGEIWVHVRSGFANINQIPFILTNMDEKNTMVKVNWCAEREIRNRGPYQDLEKNRAIIEKIILKVIEKVKS